MISIIKMALNIRLIVIENRYLQSTIYNALVDICNISIKAKLSIYILQIYF